MMESEPMVGLPDAWRHPDLYPITGDDPEATDDIDQQVAAEEFIRQMGLDPTPDAVGQLIEFTNCLAIMCDRENHPWGPDGELWRSAGLLNLTGDVYKKHERFQYRLWTKGIMHKDSGYDLINFILFCLRSDPNSRFGARGEPAPERIIDAGS